MRCCPRHPSAATSGMQFTTSTNSSKSNDSCFPIRKNSKRRVSPDSPRGLMDKAAPSERLLTSCHNFGADVGSIPALGIQPVALSFAWPSLIKFFKSLARWQLGNHKCAQEATTLNPQNKQKLQIYTLKLKTPCSRNMSLLNSGVATITRNKQIAPLDSLSRRIARPHNCLH